MKKKDTDAQSNTSATSKNSDRTVRKTPRFSFRRILPRRQSTKSVKSHGSSDVETRSDENPSQSEREATLQSIASEEALHMSDKSALECPLCLSQHPEEAFPLIMTCHHRSCRTCLQQYLKIEITESRVNITCPECAERLHPNDIKSILNNSNLMNKYEEFMLRRVLVADPDTRWCPAPDCGYAVIAAGCASCPKLKCERPGCDTSFCYHCKQYWHPNQTCDTARAERSANMRSSSLTNSNDSGPQSEIKPCPRCGAFIIKMDDGSCNHMTCAVCGAEFCWLCMKEISDLHYLSPSGCTFWGKKPWSRKKKILWQLGTLVGAPVGIGLVAGIAVPAMIIGIPVWVGRKLYAKYEHSPKHKRNLVVVGGVTASVLVSPILAGLAVGVGVPILLAYVYGVVPISLCRSGGCGLTTTDSGGVRFEFEEDNEVTVGVSSQYAAAGDAQSVETTSHHVANPSIGPSIGEVSMAMTCNSLSASGSHMDRVGVLRDESDRESASHRAIAGSSLNGSLSGSAVAGPSGFQHRLEVQADVSANPHPNKRASFSSESANFSLGDAKSATVSFSDEASTRALTGSLAGAREKEPSTEGAIPPLEVHVDVAYTSARYRHCSGESTSRSSQHKPGHTSPLSCPSVNFLSEDNKRHSKSKCYKRHSVSVGDKIHEHADTPSLDRLSMRSYTPENDLQIGFSEKVDSPVEGATSPLYTNDSLNSSSSFDSTSSQQPLCSKRAGGITQVESDKPVSNLAIDILQQQCISVETFMKTVKHGDFDRESHSSSQKSEKPAAKSGADPQVNKADRCLLSSEAADNGATENCVSRSRRRSSCQMAMQDGCRTMDEM